MALLILTATRAHAKPFLAIQQVTSPAGITAWLVEDHSQPVIALDLAFKGAGAALDPDSKQGLAHLASNTLDEGAGDLDSQRFQKTLADNSISLSFSASRDDLTGSLKTLSRHRDLAFDLLQLALTRPRFDAEAIARMKAANIARIRASESDPEWMAARLLNATAFAGHPYAKNSGGTPGSLGRITQADLKTYAAAHLSRDHLLVTVTGDITAAELRALLDKTFGALPAAGQFPAIPDIAVQGGGKTVLYPRAIPQSEINILLPGIGRHDPDYHALQLMNLIFGGSGFGSRLMTEVREKRGLTYGIYSSPQLLDHCKTVSIDVATKAGNEAQILTVLRQEMQKMRDADVTAKELADAKSYLVGSLPLGLTSTDQIAGLLLELRLDNLPPDYLDTFTAKINAVTVQDVRRVAQRLLTPDRLTTILVGPKPPGLKPQIVEALPDVE